MRQKASLNSCVDRFDLALGETFCSHAKIKKAEPDGVTVLHFLCQIVTLTDRLASVPVAQRGVYSNKVGGVTLARSRGRLMQLELLCCFYFQAKGCHAGAEEETEWEQELQRGYAGTNGRKFINPAGPPINAFNTSVLKDTNWPYLQR